MAIAKVALGVPLLFMVTILLIGCGHGALRGTPARNNSDSGGGFPDSRIQLGPLPSDRHRLNSNGHINLGFPVAVGSVVFGLSA
jgi:hypothetical protein